MAICLPLLIVILFFIIVVPLSISYTSKRNATFRRIIEMLGGKILSGNILRGSYLEARAEVIYKEHRYIFSHFPGAKNSPPYFLIKHEHFSPRILTIRREHSSDGLLKNIGLSQEIQLQDPEFNSNVYLEGEDQIFIQNFFNSSEARKAVLRLLNDFNTIEFKAEGCFLRKSPGQTFTTLADSLDSLTKDILTQAMDDFVILIKHLPTDGSKEGLDRQKTGVTNKNFAIGVIVALYLIGFGLSVFTRNFDLIDGAQALQPSLILGIILTVVVGFLLAQCLRGYAHSSKNLILGIIFLAAALILNSFIGLRILNGVLDASDPVVYETMVIEKHVSHGRKSGTTYRITVQGVKEDYLVYHFSVLKQEYPYITPKQTKYSITVRPGAFNWPWVSGRKRIEE